MALYGLLEPPDPTSAMEARISVASRMARTGGVVPSPFMSASTGGSVISLWTAVGYGSFLQGKNAGHANVHH